MEGALLDNLRNSELALIGTQMTVQAQAAELSPNNEIARVGPVAI
jgi:hypothetical protein